jgi:protein tyrosine phosphatase (PTP) superfamily phosphohydrolase (DUF442 family)
MRKGTCLIAVVLFGCVALFPLAALALEGTLNEAPIDSVFKVEGKKDLFRSTNFYFGGQPNLETLRWLKSEGVTVVINLRSEKENKEFTESSFNEGMVAKELGMSYISIPMGEKESYRPQTVDSFALVLKANKGKALIHCLSAGRVSFLWVAYLVRHRGYALDDAVNIGKRIKYPTQLEDLLGAKISLAILK